MSLKIKFCSDSQAELYEETYNCRHEMHVFKMECSYKSQK